MTVTTRRFLVLLAWAVWQGGFVFYAGVVVPIGTTVLGSAAAQGAITARVTPALNGIGVIGLLVWVGDLLVGRDPSRRRRAARWACWAAAGLAQAVLFYLHTLLLGLMDPLSLAVVSREPFYAIHRLYLWVSTVLWLATLALVWLTVRAWQAEDEQSR